MVNKETNIAPEIPSLGRSKTSERNERVNDATGEHLVVNYNPFLSGLGQTIRKIFVFHNRMKKLNKSLSLPLLLPFLVLGLLGAT